MLLTQDGGGDVPVKNRIIPGVVAAVLLLGLPATGVMLAGMPVGQYMEFPPLTRYVEHAGFSWVAFVLLAVVMVGWIAVFDLRVFMARRAVRATPPARAFPWWGWVGLALNVVAWVFAWTRFEWFAPLQQFTFSPLWFTYIVVVNALTYRRTGRCMLVDRPGYTARLFALSAAFWWYFEYLNRFVQNWYYVGIGDLSAFEYFVFATLPFSTVLPAVLGTYEFLRSFPRIGAGLDDHVKLGVARPRLTSAVVFVCACAGLAAIGVYPDQLFPLLWLAPLFAITTLKVMGGRETVLTPVCSGRWRKIYLLAMSALVCGFFWEMWNFMSMAKWIYCVPYVHRFLVFEMPLLGYAGYLPFGLECFVVAELVGKVENE